MKPYHITSNVFNSWIDLESIQMIGDLVLTPDDLIEAGMTGGMFSITLAFQDKQKMVQCLQSTRYNKYDKYMNAHSEQTEGEERANRWAQIREEQASIKNAYDDLLAAWKAL